MERDSKLRSGLAWVFGREWEALSPDDRELIIRDYTEEGGVSEFRPSLERYARNIGWGNLQKYAEVMRVRFNKKA